MKLERISATSLCTGDSVKYRALLGLCRTGFAVFISVVLSSLAAAQIVNCPLNSPGGTIQHIVYIQFDNLHLEQDNPNVPSDLQQMPNLYNFIVNNGTLFANHHTPLIAHTADDILTSLTGVYPDRHGQAVANSFVAQNPSSNKYWDEFPSSFTYWTDPVETSSTEDTAYSMIAAVGQNAPAPWVPFTRLGCNFGAVSIANMEMENTNGDIISIYGKCTNGTTSCSSSGYTPQYKESTTQAALDFEGISVHCAEGNPLCTSASSSSCTPTLTGNIMNFDGVCAEPDNLPSEPEGYSGYMGLFGHVYVVPAICPSCPITNGRPALNDLNGNAMTGFPGFGPISPAQALAYDAQMLENGVPIVYTYISDAHDCHTALPTCTLTDGYYRALGPGEAPYETQLQAYNQAFGLFFQRLANDGIDQTNTLFIIGADEQDHFVGGPAAPVGCNGVTTPCTYTYPNGYTPVGNDSPSGLNLSTGEVEGDLTQLYQQKFPSLIPPSSSDSAGANSGLTASGIFDYHYDMAPAVSLNPYLSSNTPSFARQLERATAQLTAANPITQNTDHLTNYLIDNAGLNALHMITADPARTPTFVMFANTDWYFQEQAEGTVVEQPQDYAYNHGGVAPEINTTWFSLVGPGVANNGVDSTTWTDETDIRPTILYLTGLTDDYQTDGRVVVEDLVPGALPANIQSNLQAFEELAAAYKQMNAPIGAFGQATLQGSTVALASGSTSSDSQYTTYENYLTQLTAQRNALATTIKSELSALEFQNSTFPANASSLTTQAHTITVQSQVAVLNQNTSSANPGPQQVGTAAPVLTLTYNFASPTTLSAVNILTGGQPGLDYVDGGNSTCVAGTAYISGQSCTVTVVFTPSAPGLRPGAVVLSEQGSNVPLAVWYLNGTGESSAVTIDPGTQTTLATLANSGQAYGTAVDGARNLYVVDNANDQVLEFAAQTFAPTTVVSSSAGLSGPTAVALDGAGNLYISDTGNSRVVEVPNEQGTLNANDMTALSFTGLGSPRGLAVDSSGDVYVADSANGNLLELPVGGAPQVTVASGLTSPRAVAVDNAGDVYVSTANQVTEYPAGGGTPVTIGSGFSTPSSIAVDASGVVYVADSGNSRIVRVAAGGASQTTLPATGVSNPQGIALDASASVYFTTGGNVNQINRTQAAALNFPNTNVDSTSAAQTVAVSNVGNQTLDFSSVVVTANFTVVPSGGTDCTSSTQLASALQCLVAVEFAPTSSGTLTGTLTLTDNALGNPASAQSVQLTGAGTLVSQTITFPTIPTQTYGGPSVTLNATASSGLPVSYAVIAGSAIVSGNTLTITGAGSVTVQASQVGNVEYAAATPVSQTFTVNPASQTITFSTNPPASAAYNSTFTVAASASSGLAVTFTSSGSCSNSGATYTITSGTGSCSVIANQTGNNDYTAAPQVSKSVSATPASQTITFTTSPPASAGYNSSFTVVATASSGLPVAYASAGPCSNTDSATYTITSPTGTCSVIVNQSGNVNYNPAPQLTGTTKATKGTPTASFSGAPASAAYTSTFTVSATSNSGVTPTFSASGSCSISGTTVTMTKGTGNCTTTAKWAANTDYNAITLTQTTTAEKLVSVLNWSTPAPITYGTKLSSTQLDATASYNGSSLPGTFKYTPASGAILDAGSQTLAVTFTPTASTDYTTVSDTVTLEVNQISTTTTITRIAPASPTAGALVTVSFTVSAAYGKPTGTVTVSSSGGQSCSGTLSDGEGSCAMTFSTAGSYTLTASYSGDSNNLSSTSSAFPVTIGN
jgi:hypothetical protein